MSGEKNDVIKRVPLSTHWHSWVSLDGAANLDNLRFSSQRVTANYVGEPLLTRPKRPWPETNLGLNLSEAP
jgi:hypothetical protein